MTCTPGRTGSWAPATMTADDNWLAVYFLQPVYVTALLVYEHANPPSEAGFVTSVDLFSSGSGSWVQGAWTLNDDTPCGAVLTLRAEDATLSLDALEVSGARIHTRTDNTHHGAWEYIDAVKLIGSLCNSTGVPTIEGRPAAPPTPSHAPSPPTQSPPPNPRPPPLSGAPPSAPQASPAPPPRAWLAPVRLPELAAMVMLATTFFMCVCCWFGVVNHCRRAALRRATAGIVAPNAAQPVSADGARVATLLTASSVHRATHAPPGCELVQVALHKPQSNAALGIQLTSQSHASAGAGGAARSGTRQVDVVVEALAPDSVALASGALKPGDRLAAVNGCVPASAEEAMLMLQSAEGTVMLEILRLSGSGSGGVGGGGGGEGESCEQRQRREAFNRENPLLGRPSGGSGGGGGAYAVGAPAAATGAAAATVPAPPARVAPPIADAPAAAPARPWTPRTQQREELELSEAIGAASAAGGGGDDAARLVAASKRVHEEANALRQQLAGRKQPAGTSSGGAIDPLEVPAQFRCPISQEIMEDPVTTSDGHTYERREIFRWLCSHNTSPLTGAPLPNKALTPAIALRQLIASFQKENPDLK